MKTLSLQQMETVSGDGWGRCIGGVITGTVGGFAGATGNGVAFVLGPIGVTWGAIGAIAGGVLSAMTFCDPMPVRQMEREPRYELAY